MRSSLKKIISLVSFSLALTLLNHTATASTYSYAVPKYGSISASAPAYACCRASDASSSSWQAIPSHSTYYACAESTVESDCSLPGEIYQSNRQLSEASYKGLSYKEFTTYITYPAK